METEETPLTTDERAVRIARLLELISGETAAIQRHEQPGGTALEHRQWTELREEHLAELTELIQGFKPEVRLAPSDQLAA
jgi:hypothetical protein